ncbi:Averufin oxidase A [Fulvia fulva]|uniref:Averufin oxidase A n=1 Tax=Passalora fulva TaxID=5499 RepID=A0A9Q8LD54_PASFU|nr:Averufin oxidase A [Fulvia fulva]KAK4629051.1 Averufin oxidase A [Fulvia fulva]KAK4630108.1 Averufin oxidase A [Fulvia fulva]UJO15190.1 Averufin oxidase A [Fulvia fulva]WPV12847.1 Averufin oxidase A [Fulvia fulva]WPV27215.1 Averufin oxidase A [Fulvia fulva]
MPTYALLGATGGTGSAILRCLLSEPPVDLTLRILVRSRDKLLASFPGLEQSTVVQIKIVQGTSTDIVALGQCLEGASVIFNVVATNESKVGLSLCHDTAGTVIDTLESLQTTNKQHYSKPTVIQLRSASLNLELNSGTPWLVTLFLSFCLHYIYSDIERASQLYERTVRNQPDLMDYIYIDPPALHGAGRTKRTGYELISKGAAVNGVSYADLGAAFCEVASRKDEFRGRAVGLVGTGKIDETWKVLLNYNYLGAKSRIFG